MSIDEIIKAIPQILEFFIPGYVTWYIYQKIRDSKDHISYEKVHFLSCICISFVLSIVFSWISNLYLRILAECVLGWIAAILLLKLLKVEAIRHLYSTIFHTMLSESVLESIGLNDTNKDPWASVFMKDGSMVFGRCISIPSDYEDEWIALDYYQTTGELFATNGQQKDKWYVINKKSNNRVIVLRISEIKAIAKYDFRIEDEREGKNEATNRAKDATEENS